MADSERRKGGSDQRRSGTERRKGGKDRRGRIGRIRPASWDRPIEERAQGLLCAKCGTEISIPPASEPLKGPEPPGTEAICPKCRGPLDVRKKCGTEG